MGLGPRGSLVRLVGIVLMSLLVGAWAQPATLPATEPEAFVVVTSAEQVVGTWHVGTNFLRFDKDGTVREAVGRDARDARPYAIHTFHFKAGVMLLAEVAVSGVPSCGDAVGRYEVRLLADGRLEIVLFEDPCSDRARNVTRVYEQVE